MSLSTNVMFQSYQMNTASDAQFELGKIVQACQVEAEKGAKLGEMLSGVETKISQCDAAVQQLSFSAQSAQTMGQNNAKLGAFLGQAQQNIGQAQKMKFSLLSQKEMLKAEENKSHLRGKQLENQKLRAENKAKMAEKAEEGAKGFADKNIERLAYNK